MLPTINIFGFEVASYGLIIFIGIVFLKAAGIIKLNNHIDIKDFCKWEINILILLIAITIFKFLLLKTLPA